MDEGKLHLERARAAQAERLLKDPLLLECVDRVRKGYLSAWEATGPDATDKREQLWLSLRALEQVLNEIRSVADTGKLAKRAIEQLLARQANG